MSINLHLLPRELISLIATFTDPSSILKLSSTCRTLRAACWDPLVLKAMLISSQETGWSSKSLDIEAISERAGSDATTWAKYCVADERLRLLAQDPDSFESQKTFIAFLPELLVVKHSFVAERNWLDALRYRLDQNPSQIFCIAMTILATDDSMPSLTKSLKMEGQWNLRANGDPSGFLWSLCMIALTVRVGVRTRLAAWPFNNAARVPHVDIPTVNQIPLRPIGDQYRIPAPFSRRAIELLGRSITSFSAWDSWYQLHTVALFHDTKQLTDGLWTGYYIHFGNDPLGPLNPPMADIRFEVVAAPEGDGAVDVAGGRVWRLQANNCVDGVDGFELSATVLCSNYGVNITARKRYVHQGHGWDWDCRLTPFGIVGYWGLRNPNLSTLRREGIVWLWKTSWTDMKD